MKPSIGRIEDWKQIGVLARLGIFVNEFSETCQQIINRVVHSLHSSAVGEKITFSTAMPAPNAACCEFEPRQCHPGLETGRLCVYLLFAEAKPPSRLGRSSCKNIPKHNAIERVCFLSLPSELKRDNQTSNTAPL